MRQTIGECELDIDARQLYRGSAAVHLSPKAFDLLAFLVAQRPRAVPRQELYDHLWPDTFVVEANLPILIREVRNALGDAEGKWIRTVYRHGYACAPEQRPAVVTEAQATHMLFQAEREVPLRDGQNIVGRDPASTVRFASASVSRQHAAITVEGERATIVDLGSKNGTFVDNEPVDGPRQLRDGMTLRFGKMEMVYRWSPAYRATESMD
jgi:DNA-binding winged helix-turn-helix (wHTH) protein